jgi:hypothetical protein
MKLKLNAAANIAASAFLVPTATLAGPACTRDNPGTASTGCEHGVAL